MIPEHRHGAEIRVLGRRLEGRALVYGDVSPDFMERFLPGSLAPVPAVPMNLQHDAGTVLLSPGSYELNDTALALEVRAELPAGSAALALIRRGALNGYSIEFHAKAERRDAGIRVIERAELTGIALVDHGAYPQSVAEVRRGGGGGRGSRGGRLSTFRGRIPKGKIVDCRCSPGDCTEALFEDGAFDNLTREQVTESGRDILGVVGDYGNAIGSAKRGNVRFWAGKNGDLEFGIDIPNSERGKALMETFDSVPVYGRPVLDVGASTFTREGTLARYSTAKVRAITVGPTDASAGWDALEEAAEAASELAAKAAKLAGISRPARRSARVWL